MTFGPDPTVLISVVLLAVDGDRRLRFVDRCRQWTRNPSGRGARRACWAPSCRCGTDGGHSCVRRAIIARLGTRCYDEASRWRVTNGIAGCSEDQEMRGLHPPVEFELCGKRSLDPDEPAAARRRLSG